MFACNSFGLWVMYRLRLPTAKRDSRSWRLHPARMLAEANMAAQAAKRNLRLYI
jgi:hypothetical protein